MQGAYELQESRSEEGDLKLLRGGVGSQRASWGGSLGWGGSGE